MSDARLFTIMAGLGQMEHEIKRERVVDSITKRRDAGKDLGGRPRIITDSQIRSASRLIEGGEPAAQVARAAQVPSHVLPPVARPGTAFRAA